MGSFGVGAVIGVKIFKRVNLRLVLGAAETVEVQLPVCEGRELPSRNKQPGH